MEVILKLGELGSAVKLQETLKPDDKFGKFKEVIEKETGIDKQNMIIIDEKGIDISSMHLEENFITDKNKNQAGIDLTTVQNFEQMFFNDYNHVKEVYKKYKNRINQGFKILNEIDQQASSFETLKKSINKTFEQLYQQKNQLRKKGTEMYEQNKGILVLYQDGIADLKKYELHSVFRKEGAKQYLIDIYYDEQQMNKWKDSCIRSNESLRAKLSKIDQDFSAIRQKIVEKGIGDLSSLDEAKYKELKLRIEQAVSDTEPLIMSIISNVYDDLKELHKNLNTFCKIEPQLDQIKQAQLYLVIDNLKNKIKNHQDLSNTMEEHYKLIEVLLDQINALKFKNAQQIVSVSLKDQQIRKDMRKNGVAFEIIKLLSDNIIRVEKDFSYLKHPSQLPRAYEKALIEVQRRRKFRKIIDDEYNRLSSFVSKEKEQRLAFLQEMGKILPSEFIPQLREQAPVIKIEGGQKDYDLPEIEDSDVDFFEDFRQNQPTDGGKSQMKDPEIIKKLQDTVKEMSLLKEEHKSNIKDLNTKIEQQELQINMKTTSIKDLMNQLSNKEREIHKIKEELEKTMKSLKDSALLSSQSQKITEEALARKTKEVDALAKSKNCKNCIICIEDLRDKNESALIKDLNDKLIDKYKIVQNLEEQQRKSTNLINQICQHNFNFLRQKTQDFFKSSEKSKQFYENRIMEIEDQLGLEQKRCQDLIKTRVAILEEKYLKGQQKEQELNKKQRELTLQNQSLERELYSFRNKIKDYQSQISKLQQENSKLAQDKKYGEEDSKKLQIKAEQQFNDEKFKLNDAIQKLQSEKIRIEEQFRRESSQLMMQLERQKESYENQLKDKMTEVKKLIVQRDMIQDEKTKFEEKVKKENLVLIKQLNELKEQSEKEIREKNEKILSLNNIINEQYDQQAEQKIAKINQDILEKKEKDLINKNKDLQDITLILSKRDKEIQVLKQENDKIKQVNLQMQEEIQQMKKEVSETKNQLIQMKNIKNEEFKQSKEKKQNIENSSPSKLNQSKENENVLQRIKELACNTLNLQNFETWETSLTRALTNANTFENINFMRAVEGVRVLFMPHSPGIYLAMVLKNVEDIEQDYALKSQDLNSLESSLMKSESGGPPVKKLIIKNNLFLDIESLSKNLQKILKQVLFNLINVISMCEMLVIAKIKSVTRHQATNEFNPYNLDGQEVFFKCQIEKLEHIVGFESDEFTFTDYACK